MVPDDVWAVAAVVVGDERAHLTGWQMRDAVASMTALGHSRQHIAWALKTSQQMVYNTCRDLGIRPHGRDQVVDELGVAMVVDGLADLPLDGKDRDEALRRMVADGLYLDTIARRLCSRIDVVRIAAVRIGLKPSYAPRTGFDWPHLLKQSSAAIRRLESAGRTSRGAATLPERRAPQPLNNRTNPSSHGTADLRQDYAA
jgi:hypothetical protein